MSRIAVIPARGGSKRIPGKNILPLAGKPMIAYTIEAALQSDRFARVVVSTDREEIAAIAQQFGAEVPFLREAALSDDHTPSSQVTLDVLQRLDPEGQDFEVVAQLMPNCPLRTGEDIADSLRQFEREPSQAQISVSRYAWLNPWWAMQRDASKRLTPLFAEETKLRSQDLQTIYCPTGAVWWTRSASLRQEGSFLISGYTGWEIPWDHAVDIDTQQDLRLAELLLQARLEGEGG